MRTDQTKQNNEDKKQNSLKLVQWKALAQVGRIW